MSPSAKVEIEALKEFRAALWKFVEVTREGLSGADAEIQRTVNWLRQEQYSYWKGQVRKRGEQLHRAKSALDQKKLYKTPAGGRQSCVEEEKAFRLAKKRMEEAEEKLANVRRWTHKLQEERSLYRGQVCRMGQAVDIDIPNAVARLDRMLDALDAYVSVAVPRTGPTTAESVAGAPEPAGETSSVARGGSPRGTDAGGYAWLREKTPGEDVRRDAPPGKPATRWLEGCVIGQSARRALGGLSVRFAVCQPRETVMMALGVRDQARVFLERGAPTGRGDSGWYVGIADDSEVTGYEAVRIEDLLALRPDWREILALPEGCLVVLDGGAIEAVIDDRGTSLWPPTAPDRGDASGRSAEDEPVDS